MKIRFNVLLATGGMAAILMTGCVSSKKYKASQASLAQLRNDSAQLAQQVASLNGNVQTAQDRNSALQRSLDSANSNYATSQKNLGYYNDYFTQQTSSMTQVSDQVKGALTQAGLSGDDVQQVNNVIYVHLNEDKLFKKNSAMVTTGGKQALNGIAQVIKSRSDVNVFVNNGDSAVAGGSSASSDMGTGTNGSMDNSSDMSASAAPRHHRAHRRSMASKSSGATASNTGAATANSSTASTQGASKPVHKRAHRHYSSEGGMTFSNNPRYSKNKAWALKQARMGSVANSFLQNGVDKINVTMQKPTGNSQNNIRVVIVPTMNDFSPQNSTTSNGGTR
jgi:outer membrane protein OmpA-like peptidoglycan-associated protein